MNPYNKTRPLVSCFIPAYNNPEYTRKTVNSVYEQNYRPLQLILVDDCSPKSLRELWLEKFDFDPYVEFIYVRNPRNLNFDNHRKGYRLCTGEYIINMPHDDWFIDPQFIQRAVDVFLNNSEVSLFIADSKEENGVESLFSLPQSYPSNSAVTIVSGDEYLSRYDISRFGSWAWSGVIWKAEAARYIGLYENPLFVRGNLARKMHIFSDEIVGHICLASRGHVALDKTQVSVRGRPITALTVAAKTDVYEVDFRVVINQTVFLLCSYVLISDKLGKYASGARTAVRRLIFRHIPRQYNLRMIRLSRLPLSFKLLYIILVTVIQPRRLVGWLFRNLKSKLCR